MSEAAVEKGAFIETAQRRVVRILTDSEICDLARKAADCEYEAQEREREMECAKADAAEAKKSAESALENARMYLQMVTRGTVEEEAFCGVINDVASNRIGYMRLDTGEVIEVRAMYSGEYAQMSIEDAVAPPPTHEQIDALDKYELEHGRLTHRGGIDDDDDGSDASDS